MKQGEVKFQLTKNGVSLRAERAMSPTAVKTIRAEAESSFGGDIDRLFQFYLAEQDDLELIFSRYTERLVRRRVADEMLGQALAPWHSESFGWDLLELYNANRKALRYEVSMKFAEILGCDEDPTTFNMVVGMVTSAWNLNWSRTRLAAEALAARCNWVRI